MLFHSVFFDLGPGIPQAHGAIQDQLVRRGIDVHAEVTHALELEPVAGLGVLQAGFDDAVCQDLQGIRIEVRDEITAGFRVGIVEQPIVQAYFSGDAVRSGDPMDGALDLAAVGRVAAARGWVITAVQFHDLAVGILDHVLAFNEVSIAQAHFAPGGETVVLGGRFFAEIIFFDVDHLREGHFARA